MTKDISNFPIISFVILVLVVFAILKLIKRLVPRLLYRNSYKSIFNRAYSVFELIVWMIFLIGVIPLFLHKSFFFGLTLGFIALILILLISWYAGRDFVSGFIIRANTGFKIGANIEVEGCSGRIEKFYKRNFKLINDKGEKIIIPYSKYLGKTITFLPDVKDRISSLLQIEIASDKSSNIILEEIKYFIMTHPKALINSEPSITINDYINGVYKLEINLAARDTISLAELKADIRSKYEDG